MDLKLQKRNHASLRKLTKVDENNNVIEGQDELYVRVEDVPSNLLNNDATPLSEEVFEKINWKDNNALLFTQTDTLPEPISGVTQIVSLNSGQVWCIPGSNVAAFKLGTDDLALYLKKNFQTYEAVTVLGSNTKIGALPADYNDNGNSGASTYLDITDGNIAFKMNGTQKHLLNSEKVSFTHGNGEISISDRGILMEHHSDKTTIGLTDGSFYIKGNNTQISEDLNSDKLNFYTELSKAIYGNKTIYLEFYSDQVRFLDAVNQNEMLNVKQNGSLYAYGPIYANGSNRVIDTSNIDSYIESYFNQNTKSYINSIFDSQFKEKFIEYFIKSYPDEVIFQGSATSYDFNVTADSSLFKINYSDTSDGSIMTFGFYGNEINSLDRIYNSTTGYYYEFTCNQLETSDGGDYSVQISKYDSNGNTAGHAYIRGLYKY